MCKDAACPGTLSNQRNRGIIHDDYCFVPILKKNLKKSFACPKRKNWKNSIAEKKAPRLPRGF
jgi:hypothetical protein